MYLSVPLPHAMERQLTVTYIPASGEAPVRCVVSLNKQSRVSKLKEELLKTLGKEDVSTTSIALAEVFENHIAKILVISRFVYFKLYSEGLENSTLVRVRLLLILPSDIDILWENIFVTPSLVTELHPKVQIIAILLLLCLLSFDIDVKHE